MRNIKTIKKISTKTEEITIITEENEIFEKRKNPKSISINFKEGFKKVINYIISLF